MKNIVLPDIFFTPLLIFYVLFTNSYCYTYIFDVFTLTTITKKRTNTVFMYLSESFYCNFCNYVIIKYKNESFFL